MQRKNFWYSLTWSLNTNIGHRRQNDLKGNVRVYASPESFIPLGLRLIADGREPRSLRPWAPELVEKQRAKWRHCIRNWQAMNITGVVKVPDHGRFNGSVITQSCCGNPVLANAASMRSEVQLRDGSARSMGM